MRNLALNSVHTGTKSYLPPGKMGKVPIPFTASQRPATVGTTFTHFLVATGVPGPV